jgi:hypothetical protein
MSQQSVLRGRRRILTRCRASSGGSRTLRLRRLAIAACVALATTAGLVAAPVGAIAAPIQSSNKNIVGDHVSSSVGVECSDLTADTPLTLANMEAAALCPNTRADTSVLAANAQSSSTLGTGGVSPDAGGPSCQLFGTTVIKVCFQRGQGTVVSVKYGTLGTVVLAPYVTHSDTEGIWAWLPAVASNRYARMCTAGAIGGVVASVATSGGIGIIAGATGGCITGVLAYWWR